jgi:sulfate adenylyltransferase subunit 1
MRRLNVNNKKELLRFTTAGSVDDGKSTLIGRLLYDSKSIFQDQLDSIEKSSKSKGFDYVDLSLLTDGLKSEREQGITIDVAYRYFETPKRKFIIADTPGHIQYTRNMVTGASTANLAIILIDARKGMLEQTHRHSFIASLLGIPHVIVCINKMDLLDYDQDVFHKIKSDYEKFSSKLNIKDTRFIPISALVGDNVVDKSENMTWYSGGTLLHELENVHISSDLNHIDPRFPVQMVIRPHREGYQDFRGYAGRIASGVFKHGDEVKVLPSGFTTKISKIYIADEEINEAFAPMSVTITLEDDIDISRGDMITKENNCPEPTQNLNVILTWMNEKPLVNGSKLFLKHTCQEVKAIVTEIVYEIDINTLHRKENTSKLEMNLIGKVKIRTSKPIFVDRYDRNRSTGSIILIDPQNNNTLAAGIIL